MDRIAGLVGLPEGADPVSDVFNEDLDNRLELYGLTLEADTIVVTFRDENKQELDTIEITVSGGAIQLPEEGPELVALRSELVALRVQEDAIITALPGLADRSVVSCVVGTYFDGTVCSDNKYICAAGIPLPGKPLTPNALGCVACNGDYRLDGAPGLGAICLSNEYICENGTPADGLPTGSVSVGCDSCNDGYRLAGAAGEGTACVANGAYTCTNGTPAFGTAATFNEQNCTRCNTGYRLDGPAGAGAACIANAYTCTNGDALVGRPVG